MPTAGKKQPDDGYADFQWLSHLCYPSDLQDSGQRKCGDCADSAGRGECLPQPALSAHDKRVQSVASRHYCAWLLLLATTGTTALLGAYRMAS
eukprot:6197091-Pleurochrysis_carterae.AAC.9